MCCSCCRGPCQVDCPYYALDSQVPSDPGSLTRSFLQGPNHLVGNDDFACEATLALRTILSWTSFSLNMSVNGAFRFRRSKVDPSSSHRLDPEPRRLDGQGVTFGLQIGPMNLNLDGPELLSPRQDMKMKRYRRIVNSFKPVPEVHSAPCVGHPPAFMVSANLDGSF